MEKKERELERFWIYILECNNGNYYTGYTSDLVKRYQQHVNGTANSKYTRSFKPKRISQCWQLFDTVGTALKVERFIKRQSKKTKELLIQHPDRLTAMVSEKLKITLELSPCTHIECINPGTTQIGEIREMSGIGGLT